MPVIASVLSSLNVTLPAAVTVSLTFTPADTPDTCVGVGNGGTIHGSMTGSFRFTAAKHKHYTNTDLTQGQHGTILGHYISMLIEANSRHFFCNITK